MTNDKHKRNILDDLIDFGRDVLDKIDEALLPKQQQPVRVPVPVRNDRPSQPQNPQDRHPY